MKTSRFLFAFSLLLAASNSSAQSQTTTTLNLKQSAAQETQTLSPAVRKQQNASPITKSKPQPQVSINNDSMLKLTDAYRSPHARAFNWVAGFEFGSFRASGQKSLPGGTIETINGRSNIIPRLSLGTKYNLIEAGPTLSALHMGIESGFALSSSTEKVYFPSRTFNADLSHTMIDFGLKTSVSFSRFPRLSYGLSMSFGQMNSVQTSDGTLADWSEQSKFSQTTVGADYDFSKGWFVMIALSRREKMGEVSYFNVDQQQWRTGLGFIW